MIQYEIVLDGHSLKTPGTERPYRIPSKGLAIAIALEWDQQVRGDILLYLLYISQGSCETIQSSNCFHRA